MERLKRYTCGHCKRKLGVGKFTPNPRLERGVYPWCKECLDVLGRNPERADLREYRKAYQRSYQRRYRELHGKSFNKKRRSRRSFEVQSLTLPRIRRQAVTGLIFGAWKEIVKALGPSGCKKCDRAGKEPRFVMSQETYPELIFAPSNRICWCREPDPSEVDWSEVEESLRRLTEVLNHGLEEAE